MISSENVIFKRGKYLFIEKIGKFFESLTNKYKNQGISLNNLTLLNLPINITVPSLNINEKIYYSKVRTIARRLYKDSIVKIKTRSGRKIKCSLSQCFLTLENYKIMPIQCNKLKVGDRIAIIKNLPEDNSLTEINLKDFLNPKEFWFSSEYEKAKEYRKKYGKKWINGYNKFYKIPVSIVQLRNLIKKNYQIKRGYVYTSRGTFKTKIPEKISLDSDFGYLLGIYIAEGCCSKGGQIKIANQNKKVIEKCEKNLKKFGVHYGIYYRKDNKNIKKISCIIFNSKLFSTLLKKICGHGSYNKKLSSWMINGTKNFVSGIISGYFDGDGSVNFNTREMTACSVSKTLIKDIALMLNRFEIFSTIIKIKNTGCKNGKYYQIYILKKHLKLFNENIHLLIDYKENNLLKILDLKNQNKDFIDRIKISKKFNNLSNGIFNYKIHKSIISGIYTCTKREHVGKITLIKYLSNIAKQKHQKKVEFSKDKINLYNNLVRTVKSDIIWDKITKIKIVENQKSIFIYNFISNGRTYVSKEGVMLYY